MSTRLYGPPLISLAAMLAKLLLPPFMPAGSCHATSHLSKCCERRRHISNHIFVHTISTFPWKHESLGQNFSTRLKKPISSDSKLTVTPSFVYTYRFKTSSSPPRIPM
ncbi:hypothetical protein F5883DRAFT_577633 [Diaporthe sp. PMI_573]|nr:hypothetical protein F5883DRAFT_577633 [Diaporthaceae sp. PMI_573]